MASQPIPTLSSLRRTAARRFSRGFPGVSLALMIAAAAMLVSSEYGGPAMLYALLFGIALNVFAGDPRTSLGIAFAGKQVLKFGVILLGARIGFDQFFDLGEAVLLGLLATVVLVIVATWSLSRVLGYERSAGILAGSATAICGASAALAVSAVLPDDRKKEAITGTTIVAVTVASTIAMVAYPLVTSILDLGDRAAGIVIGASIHDVAQVVGAGYTISEEAGDAATLTKLFRVFLLIPVVFTIMLLSRSQSPNRGVASLVPPPMLWGFAGLAALNSLGLLPIALGDLLSDLSRLCLLTAIAAIGVRTNIAAIGRAGKPTLVLVGFATALIFLAALGLAYF
ncbi:MAG: putative sulfate exporter family transporter [Pseudomonadota bacterium]